MDHSVELLAYDRVQRTVQTSLSQFLLRRSMLVDWRADCSAIEVSEDGASFAQLVDAMYARGMKEQALSADCIDKLSGTKGMWYISLTSELSAYAAQAFTDMLSFDSQVQDEEFA